MNIVQEDPNLSLDSLLFVLYIFDRACCLETKVQTPEIFVQYIF